MTTITTRAGKGSPLTNDEVDANFTNLNDDKVEASGDSMTGNLSFGDNNKAIFGAGSDLQIYHDGSNSIITDGGTGSLLIRGSNVWIQNADGTETGARFITDGAIDLRYDNAVKLATTSTGIDVTGNVTLESSDAGAGEGPEIFLHRNSASPAASDVLGVINFDGENSAGSQHTYGKIKGVIVDPTNTSEDGKLVFQARGAGAGFSDIMTVASTGIDVTGTVTADGLTVEGSSAGGTYITSSSGSAAGDVKIEHIINSSRNLNTINSESGSGSAIALALATGETKRLNIASNGDISFYEPTGTNARIVYDASAEFAVNQDGADFDFRVESDSNTHMLFVDAGNDYVGIGDSTPEATLHVEMSGGVVDSVNKALIVQANTASAITNDGGTGVVLRGKSSGGNIANYEQAMIASYGYASNNQHGISFWTKPNGSTNLTQKMRLEADGQMVMQRGAKFNTESVSDNNADFQVASDSNTHMLFVDAGNSRVGFVTSAPDRPVHLKSSGTRNYIKAETTGTTDSAEAGFDVKAGSNNYLVGALGGTDNRFYIYDLTNALDKFTIKQGDIIINDSGVDGDFRVESDSNANALKVDAGNSRVGINVGTPVTALNVSSGTASDIARFDNTNGGYTFGMTSNLGSLDLASAAGFRIRHGATESAYFSADDVVINNGSADQNFRVESDNKASALFVDAGNDRIMVGRADVSVGEDFCAIDANPSVSGHVIRTGRDDNSTKNHIVFINPNGTVGSIQTAASTTIYNTSSDARLKENIEDADDAGALIDAIQVRQFDWIADGEHQRYGMVAQELNTVAPEAVSEGETEEDMMGVDYSKLVPMLVKEIQSLRARVAQLESN